jgi:hypothetical protein
MYTLGEVFAVCAIVAVAFENAPLIAIFGAATFTAFLWH